MACVSFRLIGYWRNWIAILEGGLSVVAGVILKASHGISRVTAMGQKLDSRSGRQICGKDCRQNRCLDRIHLYTSIRVFPRVILLRADIRQSSTGRIG